jgi:hypothetical protein
LAQRLKQAMVNSEEKTLRDERAFAEDRARKTALRRELLHDLAEFAGETDFIDVRLEDGALVLGRGAQTLRFQPDGDEDNVLVTGGALEDGVAHRLYVEGRIGDVWVWEWRRGRRAEREAFWDDGLEALLVRGLQLPAPD